MGATSKDFKVFHSVPGLKTPTDMERLDETKKGYEIVEENKEWVQ